MTQMCDELVLRPFEKSDFEPLAELVGRTWLAEFPPAAQLAAGRVELAHYLSLTTWSLVAVRAGAVLGAVLLSERDAATPDAATWEELASRLATEGEKNPES